MNPEALHDPAGTLAGGHLKGYIDLAFEWQDRFYILDWKSNHLGDLTDDYTQPRLLQAMVKEQYFLQYHLYSVALHRFLARRKSGYSYDRNFGGVFYLFLRGLGENGTTGIFFDRPNETKIERLCTILCPEG